jgi:hypothetical protein
MPTLVRAFKGRVRGHLRRVVRDIASLSAWQAAHPHWPATLFSSGDLANLVAVQTRMNAALAQTMPALRH